jgi:hypothetical protein
VHRGARENSSPVGPRSGPCPCSQKAWRVWAATILLPNCSVRSRIGQHEAGACCPITAGLSEVLAQGGMRHHLRCRTPKPGVGGSSPSTPATSQKFSSDFNRCDRRDWQVRQKTIPVLSTWSATASPDRLVDYDWQRGCRPPPGPASPSRISP